MTIMEQSKFNQRIAELKANMQTVDCGDTRALLEMQMALPAKTNEDRNRLWTSIRSIAGMTPGLVQKGRRTKLSPTTIANVKALHAQMRASAITFWESGNNRWILRKAHDGAKTLFSSGEDWADYFVNARMGDMKKRADPDNQMWDGTIEGLESQKFPAKPEKVEVHEEE